MAAMRVSRPSCFLVALLALFVACTPGHPEEREKPGFVRRDATRLVLDGRPYLFHGLNYYDLAAFAQELPDKPGYRMLIGCRTHSRAPVPSETLPRMGAAANAVRTFFFQPYATAVPLAGGPSARDWSVFDRALAAIRGSGMRAIIAFTDQFGNCELPKGVDRDIDWYRSRYRTEVVPGLPSTYRDYVREIVTRYRDRPEILAWQLISEATVPNADGSCDEENAAKVFRAFVDDVAGLVKSIDANHLVSIGTGRSGCGIEGPNRTNYRMVFSSPSVDLCEYHDYYDPTVPLPKILRRLLQICGEQLGKPLFVGETGMTRSDAGDACPQPRRFTACRARLLSEKFAAQLHATDAGFAEDVVGEMVWSWCEPLWTRCNPSKFDVAPGDPVLSVLASLPSS
jgi:mannan endo-1,4-beta-mannosidase